MAPAASPWADISSFTARGFLKAPKDYKGGACRREVFHMSTGTIVKRKDISIRYCLDMYRNEGKAAVIAAGQVIGFVPEEGAEQERRKPWDFCLTKS